jgi:murein DD-endopeptidase MepM/ murein hydrolase activator NlpD
MTIPCSLALAVAIAAQADDAALRVSHRARALTPGEVVLVTVRSSAALEDVRGEWLGQPLVFHEIETGTWQGLAPIDLSVRAGRFMMHLRAAASDGRELVRDYPIVVAPRTFPTRRISVEGKFAEPPAGELTRIEQERRAAEAIFASVPGERLWTAPFVVPVPGKATSSFGRRSIVNGQPRSPHSGTDFQAASGTPVVAPNRGRVALAADHYFPGRTIILDHGAGVYSYLAHLSEIGVAEGEMVERGQEIARSGATGRVTGPHLHWTMRLGSARVDPLSLVAVLRKDRGAKPK